MVAWNPARIAVGVGVLCAAAFAWMDAGAAVLYKLDPGLVLKFRPGNPSALSAAVDRRTLYDGIAPPNAAEAQQLGAALAQRPLAVTIVRQLAMADDLQGRSPKAGDLLAVANRLSRRDLLTELLLSDREARAGRTFAALRHFDAALSTNSQANVLLYPPLTATVSNARFRPAIASYLGRPWAPAFLDHAVRNADPAQLLATVSLNPAVRVEQRFQRFRGDLVIRLVNEGEFKPAFAYAVAGPPRDVAALRTYGFTAATTANTLGPLLWRLTNADGVYVTLAGSGLIVSVDPDKSATIAERYFALGSGAHVIRSKERGVQAADDLSGGWRVTCAGSGSAAELGSQNGPIGAQTRATVLKFTVPAGCDAVRVAFEIVNRSTRDQAEADIAGFALTKDSS